MIVKAAGELRTQLKDFVDAWTATMESTGIRVEKSVEQGELTKVSFYAQAARLTIVAAYDGFWGELQRFGAHRQSTTVDFYAGTLPQLLTMLKKRYCAPDAEGKRTVYDMTSMEAWFACWVSIELADFISAWRAVMQSRGIRTERLSVADSAASVLFHAEHADLEISGTQGGYRARLTLTDGRSAVVHCAALSSALTQIQVEYGRLQAGALL
jgi:hypothetical protein